jgi:predicted alpha/beta-fold hydrolase
VVQNYHDEVDGLLAQGGCVGSVLTKTGSHIPFYEGLCMNNWAEKVTFEFFDAFLASEK